MLDQHEAFQLEHMMSGFKLANDLACRLASMRVEPLADAVCHLDCHSRVDEVGCAYLYCRSSSKHEFDGIMRIHYASKTYDWYANGFRHLPYTADSYRLDSWARLLWQC